jgi:hypothetical protein
MEDLKRLQQWLFGAVTSPVGANDVERHLLPSLRQPADARLAVYQKAYIARLLEVLQSVFPCTRFAVGQDLFDEFGTGYIQTHPPRSYTLAHLADKFADYLESTRPADWGAFVVELVRLEQAIDRVFDAPGAEELPPFSLPDSVDASLKLRLVPGFELRRFEYPVSQYYTDWKAGRESAWPEAREQCVALLRREYVVRRYELTAVQHSLLAAIQSGAALGEALAAAVHQSGREIDSLTTQVQDWFEFWAAERFFA